MGNTEVAQALIDARANLEARDEYGGAPLHEVDNAEVAQTLINARANP